MGFCLRPALRQAGAQRDFCFLPAGLHRRAVPSGRRAYGAGKPARAGDVRAQFQGALPGKDGLVLLRLYLRAAHRAGAQPRPLRGDGRAAGLHRCAGGRRVHAGAVRYHPAFPRQQQPAPAGPAQEPCRRAAGAVGG